MSVTLIQDLRWGDTGKGKISAHESDPELCDISVRAVGGGNAGHVIKMGTREMSLHLMPAGCIHEGVDVVMGRGMVTHLPTLLKEIDEVREKFETDPLKRLIIAPENHILFDGHKRADKAMEQRRGEDVIGTTGSGIGPAYADKALRVGVRMEELNKSEAHLKDRYRGILLHWAANYGVILSSTEEDKDVQTLLQAKEVLGEHVVPDMTEYWRKKLLANARVVIEGAQGSLLSVDNGGYPYVTASATTTNGHMQGAGLPMRTLGHVIGTLKAYDTRVGSGDMRTRLSPEQEKRMRQKGGEFGSTTGRARGVGWLDAQDTQKRAWEESVTQLAILKGDIMDGEVDIPVAFGTKDGKPDYVNMRGWEQPIRGMKSFNDLPDEAKVFYKTISDFIGVPLRFIGTGPENDELIDLLKQ